MIGSHLYNSQKSGAICLTPSPRGLFGKQDAALRARRLTRCSFVSIGAFMHCLPSLDQLAALREAAGISRAEMAERLGVSKVTIWRIETGQTEPRAGLYLAMVDILRRYHSTAIK